MKAQAWVSGINTQDRDTSSTRYTGSTHRHLQSQLTTSVHPDGTQLVERWSQPVRPSAIEPSVALTTASALPTRLSRDDTVVERTTVENIRNPLHSFAIMTDNVNKIITLATPMKRIDSISASAGHLKTSTIDAHQSVSNPSSTHYEGYRGSGVGCSDYVQSDRHTKQSDTNFGPLPQVQSITEHYGSKTADLQKTLPVSFRNMQRQAADIAGVLGSRPENSVVDRESVGTKTLSDSLAPILSAANQSAAVPLAATSSVTVSGSDVSSLQTSHKKTRLNELWHRFSQDHTVCSSRATSLSMSGIEQSESGVMDSNMQQSRYEQSVVEQAAREKLQDTKMAENQQQQSLNGGLVTSSSLKLRSAPLGSTTNIVHRNSSFDNGQVSQHNTEKLPTLQEAHIDMENQPKVGKPSKPDDAGKVSSLPGSVPIKHAWIVRDETLPVVPENTTLDSVMSDFTSTSSVDDMGNIVTHTTKRHLPNDPKLLRLQQKIAQQREKHRKVRQNEQRRKEHIVKMELALRECQLAVQQRTAVVKKSENAHHPSPNQLEISTSSATFATVTSNDSDMTVCSSSVHPDDRHLTDNSQLLLASDTSGSCTCQEVHREQQRVASVKANEFSVQKRHKSDTAFKPKLQEVKYIRNIRSKITKSAPVLSRETSSHVQERNASAKNVGRKANTSSVARRTRLPQSVILKNAQGDIRSPSKANKSATLSKTNYTSRILIEKNGQVSMLSKAIQTTPRLKDNQVSYVNTAVQCPAVSCHFDDLGVITVPVMSKSHHISSLSSEIFSPDSSSDADIQQCLKHKSLMKQPLRASLPRELLINVSKINICFVYRFLRNFQCKWLRCLSSGFVKSRFHCNICVTYVGYNSERIVNLCKLVYTFIPVDIQRTSRQLFVDML